MTTEILALIPTYNESANVGRLIRRLLDKPDLDLEILVIDEEFPDGTDAVVEDIC